MQSACVGALVVSNDFGVPRILLGKRAANRRFYPTVWDVPGGHVESGETPEEALVRELQEEIGVTPIDWRPMPDLKLMVSTDERPLVLYLFAVLAWNGSPSNLLPDEHAELAWFTAEDACQLALAHPDYPDVFRHAAEVARQCTGPCERENGPEAESSGPARRGVTA